jgi:hypothetical protein
MFENLKTERLFGPKWEKISGGWTKFHNEQLHNLYCSPNIISVVKLRRMRCVGHVAAMEKMRIAYKMLVG